ncbi:STAS domain-containing protein [Streptomyces sp. NPDC047014]|uniref:STAS domain-containing protein n=1 Tax=Streptomyces sp. NPDC047014 TaxID=3155736 RepID=UPI0034030956
MDRELRISHRPAPPGTRVVALAGEVDLISVPRLADALNEALAALPLPRILVVDCSGLEFCDCAGLNELLRVRRAAGAAGTAFRLAAPNRQVARLLELTGTEAAFDVLPSTPAPDAARSTYRRPATGRGDRRTVAHAPRLARPEVIGMRARTEALAVEAARQVKDGQWELSVSETELARFTAEHLAHAVGPPADQRGLPVIERLERLREALAHVAMAIARTHGQLAWFLAQNAEALAPVLHWRTLTAGPGQSFGTVVPTPAELADAEDAVRRLQTALAGLSTAAEQVTSRLRPEIAP